jgi:hypothetical protein
MAFFVAAAILPQHYRHREQGSILRPRVTAPALLTSTTQRIAWRALRIRNIVPTLKKLPSLLQRCSCKFQSHRIDSWHGILFYARSITLLATTLLARVALAPLLYAVIIKFLYLHRVGVKLSLRLGHCEHSSLSTKNSPFGDCVRWLLFSNRKLLSCRK